MLIRTGEALVDLDGRKPSCEPEYLNLRNSVNN